MLNKLISLTLFLISINSIASELTEAAQETNIAYTFGAPSDEFNEIFDSSEPFEPQENHSESEKIKSPANHTYYCVKNRDLPNVSEATDPAMICAYVSQFGYFNTKYFAESMKSFPEDLHPNIMRLYNQLIHYFSLHPYIGTQASNLGMSSIGWLGSLSIKTLVLLDDLAKVQDTLPADQKMKFLSVGAGSGFFEKMLSAVGSVSAMDVCDESLRETLMRQTVSTMRNIPFKLEKDERNKVGDYSDMQRRLIEHKFFAPVKVYSKYSERQNMAIVEDTFKDCDFENTVLVLCWPREYAAPYIAKFIKNGGKTILFVHCETVSSAFHSSHLGNPDTNKSAKSILFALTYKVFRKTNLTLNTATFSSIELFTLGEFNPTEKAINTTISRFETPEI